jgi:hypothetical protein
MQYNFLLAIKYELVAGYAVQGFPQMKWSIFLSGFFCLAGGLKEG